MPQTINLLKIRKYGNLESPLMIIIALYLFNYFKSLNINYNKVINYIAGSVFGIYLIHENIFVRPYIWQRLVKYLDVNSWFYIFKFLIICVLVFLSCLVLDIIIKFIIEKPINKISCYLDEIIMKAYNKIKI